MFNVEYQFYLILLNIVLITPQLNLYHTNSLNTTGKDIVLQYNCLYAPVSLYNHEPTIQVNIYCMNEFSSKFVIETIDYNQKLRFDQLANENITSQQLYLWSVPIDIIEDYQFYLNQLSIGNTSSLSNKTFYNCTWPRFGSLCQYEFYSSPLDPLPVHDIISNFYQTFPYNPINLTCYEHLECHYRTFAACLDWTEICDGNIDCINDGIDEEHCWQLEINQCNDDEYRCFNGQCVAQSFYNEESQSSECFDRSDRPRSIQPSEYYCRKSQPSFQCEDVIHNHDFGIHIRSSSRRTILLEKISWNNTNSTSSECWLASKCLLRDPNSIEEICRDFCAYNACIHIVARYCPDILELTDSRFSFGHLSLYYKKIIDQNLTTTNLWHLYICYSLSYFNEFFQMFVKIQLNNRTCFFYETISWPFIYENVYSINHTYLTDLHQIFRKYNLPNNFNSTICQRSNMYQCMNSSKCISIYRLFDITEDCPYMDDEDLNIINKNHVMKQLNKTHMKCQLTNKYIPKFFISDSTCQCDYDEYGQCEDEKSYDYIKSFDSLESLSFQTICDGFIELKPNEQNHTDETECEQWSCDNIYTHCDNVWNCLNGTDEVNCNSSIFSRCSPEHYQCVSQDTKQLICLPFKQINDGRIDCLGATDEILFCRKSYASLQSQTFYCNEKNITTCIYPKFVCNHKKDCFNGNDEDFCEQNRTISTNLGICTEQNVLLRSDTEKILCNQIKGYFKSSIIYFKLDEIESSTIVNQRENNNNILKSNSLIQYQSLCQRGLHLLVWLNKTSTTDTCLCPPSYYGSHCQYQNQRLSLTIRFRAPADSYRTVFVIVISLIENTHDRIIHSYEQIPYLSLIHCTTKFNIYLQYSTRKKDLNKQYAIQIDFYEKISLNYRGSILLPVTLIFLPIQRLAVSVDIPSTPIQRKSSSIKLPCVHGELIDYSNNPDIPAFCRCHSGWSGQYCTINFTCNCASHLQCVGMTASNRSICICPINTFGSRCILTKDICQNKSLCENDGQCIASDEYFSSQQSFICLCRNGFQGDRCEIIETKLTLSFDTSLTLLQSVFIHFIQVFYDQMPKRSTTFRTISFQQNSLVIYWSQPFHLVFIELDNKTNYYLTVKQHIYNQSIEINRTISSSDHCPHIRDLFNASFMKWNLIRRIKYYHLPCQNTLLNLSCFYDEAHLCLCYDFHQQRLANCFNFTHGMKFDCSGQSVCENDGQCFQDAPHCPTRSICMCTPCFYGTQCQFTTIGFSLTLDAILGYYIQPNVDLVHQPFLVKISLVLAIIFITFALIDSALSLMTFKNTMVREIGCGLYLLSSSMATFSILILFTLKFFILLYAQMARLTNRTFLLLQCQSIDFLLRISIYMDQWLYACVATERAYTIIKKIHFDKKKSKRTAKTVIVLLVIVITASAIHDPIHRILIDEKNNNDENMKRIWCIVRYDSSLQLYDLIISAIHFIGPFIINLISTIVLIVRKSQQQKYFNKQQSYRTVLCSQFQENKHLITAPIVLIILALPRLAIVLISKCLKSSNDAWIYLIGYFISFIPHMLTFVVFVMPSNFYKQEFWKTVTQLKTRFGR